MDRSNPPTADALAKIANYYGKYITESAAEGNEKRIQTAKTKKYINFTPDHVSCNESVFGNTNSLKFSYRVIAADKAGFVLQFEDQLLKGKALKQSVRKEFEFIYRRAPSEKKPPTLGLIPYKRDAYKKPPQPGLCGLLMQSVSKDEEPGKNMGKFNVWVRVEDKKGAAPVFKEARVNPRPESAEDKSLSVGKKGLKTPNAKLMVKNLKLTSTLWAGLKESQSQDGEQYQYIDVEIQNTSSNPIDFQDFYPKGCGDFVTDYTCAAGGKKSELTDRICYQQKKGRSKEYFFNDPAMGRTKLKSRDWHGTNRLGSGTIPPKGKAQFRCCSVFEDPSTDCKATIDGSAFGVGKITVDFK